MTKAYGCLQGEGVQTWLVCTHVDGIFFFIVEDFLDKKDKVEI